MPRFSVAFSKRKSASDDFEHAPITTPEQHSFRVIERNDVANVRSFDGGARMARHAANKSANMTPKPNLLELNVEDNMFADLKANRGSGISNTTNATSTDNSSRHSNASTAPSSTDFGPGSGQDESHRYTTKQHPQPQPQSQPQPQPQTEAPPSRGGSKSSFLDRATRTFSFGGQKKHSIPPPKEDRIPDMPPMLTLQGDNGENRPRGMTASTASTATPTNAEDAALDLGGDFGSMFTSFDKRASVATLKSEEPVEARVLTGHRNIQPAPMSPDTVTAAEPLLGQRQRPTSDDAPPPVPRHQTPGGSFKYSHRPSDIVEDEDAKLLRESFTAMKFLSSDPNDSSARTQTHRYRRDDDVLTAASPKPIASAFSKEDNMFEGSLSRTSKASHRLAPRAQNPAQNKVMTPAQFEKYRQDKERQGSSEPLAQSAVKDDEDEDEINYDDDDDEQEKSKQQAKQRRKQEAHMAVYRQQMMKVTGETASAPAVNRHSRPALLPSTSAPQLSHMKAPSPEPATVASDEDEDEDVPLGILQAHGFPARNRPPTRLSYVGSNSNLRATAQGMLPGRPASTTGESISNASRRHSMLPAFARNLPQDPFVGASIARPAVRESLAFGDAGHPPQQQGPPPPGGLVGVIVSEERSRAMRRGSPSLDNRGMMAGGGMGGLNGQGFDPATGIPHQMMYNAGGMPGMSHMQQMHQPPPMLTPGDQAQIQMTQQMQQFMQMQMQFMQMMAGNQDAGNHPMQPLMQPPYGAGFPANQSMVDLSSRHSVMGEPMMMDPHRMDHGMRTMSMVQPSSASFIQQPQYAAPSIRGSYAGYAPSIAPSERSNVGLPGRYRPVSQAAQAPMTDFHHRASTMSGGLSEWNDDKNKSTVKVVNKKANEASDDDDEEGWEAMKAKREKKRSLWRSKKSHGSELAL